MPTLNMTDQMTALELVRRTNQPDPFHIIELMRLTNEMLIDVPAFEANNGTINSTLQRNIKAYGSHRIYNQGVKKVATQTGIVYDRIAVLGAESVVDATMLEHSGNIAAARQSEAFGIIKGMGITQADTCIYGDGNKADEFDGLMTRRNSLSDPNVIDAGGTGDELTSIYLAAVGRELFHLIYPKGSNSVGVTREDDGKVTVQDGDGNDYKAYREMFQAQYGLSIKAPDAVKRICNIPKTMTGAELVDIIIEARYRLPPGASTYVMYSNMEPLIKIDKSAREKGNVIYTTKDPWGQEITQIRDIRCRRMDVILNTEARVA
jgi:hypothetical protein